MIPLTFCAIAFRIALTVWVLSIPTFTGVDGNAAELLGSLLGAAHLIDEVALTALLLDVGDRIVPVCFLLEVLALVEVCPVEQALRAASAAAHATAAARSR